ncbi:hypothetical protein JHK87_039831 [Glycine soja]|nr:hypothetical protein JHK87_039831 [Glycine soja]
MIKPPPKAVEKHERGNVVAADDPLGELVKKLYVVYQKPIKLTWDRLKFGIPNSKNGSAFCTYPFHMLSKKKTARQFLCYGVTEPTLLWIRAHPDMEYLAEVHFNQSTSSHVGSELLHKEHELLLFEALREGSGNSQGTSSSLSDEVRQVEWEFFSTLILYLDLNLMQMDKESVLSEALAELAGFALLSINPKGA